MEIRIPELALVVLIGPSGSGKSTFAKRHFLDTEVISSDFCRKIISDDENDQTVTPEAFELVHKICGMRLSLGKLTVVDATNVQREARKPYISIAREFHCIPCAFVFNLPEKICRTRNKARMNRNFGPHVIRKQRSQMRRSIRGLKKEGLRHIHIFDSEDIINSVTIKREPLWNNKKELKGPFDIIGDIHGCCYELESLLDKLGYQSKPIVSNEDWWGDTVFIHPEGRIAIFLGDIVDRGPRILDSLRVVRNMIKFGSALCVPGNHDMKFMRKLKGKNVQLTHGLDKSVAEIDSLPEDIRDQFCEETINFLDSLVSHYVLDDGKLVVAHAGMKQNMQGRGSGIVRNFALYGETTGETDEFGLPVRYNWASEYRGAANVVYGHTPIPEPEWLNRTINVDTGCVFGGRLTALRYPEKELISFAADNIYCETVKPFYENNNQAQLLTSQQIQDNLLDAEDVLGKRIINTRLRPNITIKEENATAAIEVMSRFAINPKWLIYLSPTMSPCEASHKKGYLEYPIEAFSYYRSAGIPIVVCEEKHMGSRGIIIICKDEGAAKERFGIIDEGIGNIYTRTGRRFFNNKEIEQELILRLNRPMEQCGFWDDFNTNWACLDCEIMPWSAKAQELIRTQYASVGTAGKIALDNAIDSLILTSKRHDLEKTFEFTKNSSTKPFDIDHIINKYRKKREMVEKYSKSYENYCWSINRIEDLKIAPFHLLATENQTHFDKDHIWHMNHLHNICKMDEDILISTNYKKIDVTDADSQDEAEKWWLELTEKGGEGMVVKPLNFVSLGKKGLIQPAVKVRGKKYLRIIYGPEYTDPTHLERLRSRGLGVKRSLALREFSLGIEALERFVREPLRRVHECVFGVLALESEPVDPRL